VWEQLATTGLAGLVAQARLPKPVNGHEQQHEIAGAGEARVGHPHDLLRHGQVNEAL
jgi:hypothetical protein